jgi:hypothetical protein
MTVIHLDRYESERGCGVWRCEGCGCVHVRAESALLTFTLTEFAAFTEVVNDCYWRQVLACSFTDSDTGLNLLPTPFSL